jgi:CubicO group peptidase (beta-lactamase class C family)
VAVVLALSTVNRIEEIVSRTQHFGRAPAVIAGVVRDGRLAYVTGVGEHPAADRATQFRIGSISKTFTAALLIGLRDDGRLSLDDPLAAHLCDVSASVGAIPLRRLLAHAGGLQREPDGPWWERHAGVPLAQLLAGVTEQKLTGRQFGEYHYSNLAYGLLGGVVERVTGVSWLEALTARLLEPLGMPRTTYDPQEPYARGYVVHPWLGTLREEPRHDAGAMAPAGQLWSTVEDLARWAAVLASAPPGGALNTGTVLAPASVAEMSAPAVIGDAERWSTGYGLGLQLWRRGERVFCGHTGSMPGYLAVLCVHRPSRTAAVGFANAYTLAGTTIADVGLSIVEAVLEHEPARPLTPWRASGPPPEDIAPLCGRWWWMGQEAQVEWDAATGQLVMWDVPPVEGDEWRFRSVAEDCWLGVNSWNAGEILAVARDEDGEPTALDIATFVFTRQP